MVSGIYCFKDIINENIVYIGKDSNINLNSRFKQHMSPSKYNEQVINRILQNNPERYSYHILKSGDFGRKLLSAIEIIYIHRYSPKFNYTKGGEGTYGFKHSEESKKKISEAHKKNPYWLGKSFSEKTKQKMSISHKGKSLSTETKQKISDAHKGKKFSEEHRKNISLSKKGNKNPMFGKKLTESHRNKISESNKGLNVRDKNGRWKNHARIVKCGYQKSGSQIYGIMYDGKRLKRLTDKSKLVKWFYSNYPDVELREEING